MKSSDRVIGLIESRGFDYVLDICSKLSKNNKVEISPNNVISFYMKDFKSPEHIYTLEELLSGLEAYTESTRLEDDRKYKSLREAFEPIVKDTEWYKNNYSLGSCGSGAIFSFFNGKYTQSQMIQGMFEVFQKAYQQ